MLNFAPRAWGAAAEALTINGDDRMTCRMRVCL